jgi:hypothetical protein
MVANQELPGELRPKIGASDLVQATCLEAQRNFGQFKDLTEAELLAWLRRILRNNLANASRHYYGKDKRQGAREVALGDVAIGQLANGCTMTGNRPANRLWPKSKARRWRRPCSSCRRTTAKS